MRLLLGAVGGATAGLLVWWWAGHALDKKLSAGAERLATELGGGRAELDQALALGQQQLTAQVQQQVAALVPPAVEAQMHQTLSQYGITPQTGRRIDEALRLAERAGVL